MILVLLFAITLVAAALISELAGRTILSISVLFLLVGIGASTQGWIEAVSGSELLNFLAEVALVSVLYTDAAKIGVGDLVRAWHLPGRALLLGMPLTLVGTAVLAHWLAGLDAWRALLVGAVLSPTDPVFASALINSRKVPARLRHLLNVESGVNDGLALPAVLFLMNHLSQGQVPMKAVALQLLVGIGIGITVPWSILVLERSRFFRATRAYVPILGFSVILLVFSLARVTHANEFLGAFAAGVTVASVESGIRERFLHFSEDLAELLKLGALLIFGGMGSIRFLREFTSGEILFAVLAVVLVRPLAILISLTRSELTWRERLVAGWFGPKGFASVVFGLLVFNSKTPGSEHLFHLIALVVTGSIVLLSTTDVLAERGFSSSDTHPMSQEGRAP